MIFKKLNIYVYYAGVDPEALFIRDTSCIQDYIENQALQISSITFELDFLKKFYINFIILYKFSLCSLTIPILL